MLNVLGKVNTFLNLSTKREKNEHVLKRKPNPLIILLILSSLSLLYKNIETSILVQNDFNSTEKKGKRNIPFKQINRELTQEVHSKSTSWSVTLYSFNGYT